MNQDRLTTEKCGEHDERQKKGARVGWAEFFVQ